MLSSVEKTRRWRDKLHEAGFMQKIVWVKRDTKGLPKGKMSRLDFIHKVDELLVSLPKSKSSRIYSDVIKFIESKEEIKNQQK